MSSEHLLSLHKPKVCYGCVFCLTGKERLVANGIELFSKKARARAVCQTMRHTQNGVTRLSDDVVIPGYVFFEAPEEVEVHDLVPVDDLISVLSYSDGDWRLFGDMRSSSSNMTACSASPKHTRSAKRSSLSKVL